MDFNSKKLSDQFDKAVSFISGSNLSDVDTQLKLYGFYKQAIEGTCTQPKPPIYDLKGRKKWYAWSEMGSMSKEEAMTSYINLVKTINPNIETEKTGWVTVSTFANDEIPLSENEKTISDWVKEGDLNKIKTFIGDINVHDCMGMAPIHWASDRGDLKILRILVENHSADVNLQDNTGQTALHYAVSCSHEEICKYLVSMGARINIQDEDGFTALEMCLDEKLKSLLSMN
ncbi:acyl-CoA-binding domain-containing protein 1 [Acyrthosiphon pisum]|uniref:Acyl-CoA-binding domain-containing protein 6 n=1 Tax=Acyrthosiphon pisum TaxID=7029 RepID=A0A8R2NN24_ACYPI|nr:acyl-CoA-binding domain-containing protein 1 [Acyrthosiphon pisum]|eukprot:XP_003243339.1 PREDICTED: acyl-CoA-binding domain-containing protein 1 [Acyrthosiphon pisum]